MAQVEDWLAGMHSIKAAFPAFFKRSAAADGDTLSEEPSLMEPPAIFAEMNAANAFGSASSASVGDGATGGSGKEREEKGEGCGVGKIETVELDFVESKVQKRVKRAHFSANIRTTIGNRSGDDNANTIVTIPSGLVSSSDAVGAITHAADDLDASSIVQPQKRKFNQLSSSSATATAKDGENDGGDEEENIEVEDIEVEGIVWENYDM